VIFHSDRGSEYSAETFDAACTRLGVVQSMGRVGSEPPRRVRTLVLLREDEFRGSTEQVPAGAEGACGADGGGGAAELSVGVAGDGGGGGQAGDRDR
jgi:hypothetical protein